ncbi:MAG: hypothetical protein QF599_13160, partial [Planctomycetota bacterium]|nr:hypothetical protein [Planctomycetota bacterium]
MSHGLLLAAVGLALSACQVFNSGPRRPVVPVDEAASEAFAEARLLLATDALAAEWDRARDLARRAVELEPTWAAPRRLLDDLARGDLAGAAALAGHLEVIEAQPTSALHLYLAARLEGASEAAAQHMRAAATADDSFAWGHHGLAWLARRNRRFAAAEMYAGRALERARDPYEKALFTEMVARAAAGADELERAVAILDTYLEGPVPEPERSRLAVLAVQLLASMEQPEEQDGAFERGCELLALGDLVPGELMSLTRTLSRLRTAVGLRHGAEATGRRLRTALAMGRRRAAQAEGVGASRGTSWPWDALYGELLLEASPTPLALQMLEDSGVRLPATVMRAARFAAGRPREAVNGWLRELPDQVLDGFGLPLQLRLAELVRAANAAPESLALRRRASLAESAQAGEAAPMLMVEARKSESLSESAATQEPLLALGEICLESGWFAEARACAGLSQGSSAILGDAGDAGDGGKPGAAPGALPARALTRELYAAAEAGQFALDELARTLERMDADKDELGGSGSSSADHDSRAGAAGIDLDEVLAAARAEVGDGDGLSELLLRLAPALTAWETLRPRTPPASETTSGAAPLEPLTLEGVLDELKRSPRVSFSGIGEMVHCGPLFSMLDEAAGRGDDGAEVPGLASFFSGMGRFGLFGTHALDPVPDGVVLPLVLAEFRRGTHLGVPWSGTVLWCEGADLAPRAARSGARITGSALHEGYWVDIEAVRGEQEAWHKLARRFFGPAALANAAADGAELTSGARQARLRAALASRGLDLARQSTERVHRDRLATTPLLGAGQLVRLAVLADADGVPPTLSTLVATTARHEEGHLCDRSRFLPLSDNKAKALGFFMRCGFSPEKVMRRLEYRAQLTALCVDDDPRLALAQVLLAADRSSGSSSILPHGAAYRELLDDFIETLDRALDDEPGTWPQIH